MKALLDQDLPRPRPLSGPVAPELRWERFSAIAHELPPLFEKHWRELALNQDAVRLDPDWDKFYTLDIGGVLRVLTVRDNGILVGYLFGLFGPHLHYASTNYGHSDMFWLDPVYRQGWTGVKLFKELLRAAKEWGITVVTVPIKLHFMNARVGRLLERLGFKAIETIYARRI